MCLDINDQHDIYKCFKKTTGKGGKKYEANNTMFGSDLLKMNLATLKEKQVTGKKKPTS